MITARQKVVAVAAVVVGPEDFLYIFSYRAKQVGFLLTIAAMVRVH